MPRRPYATTRRPAPPLQRPVLASWLLVHVAFPALVVLAVGLLVWPIVSGMVDTISNLATIASPSSAGRSLP